MLLWIKKPIAGRSTKRYIKPGYKDIDDEILVLFMLRFNRWP